MAGSVSKTTSYLVAGENTGESKLASATKLGVTIIDEAALNELLGPAERSIYTAGRSAARCAPCCSISLANCSSRRRASWSSSGWARASR